MNDLDPTTEALRILAAQRYKSPITDMVRWISAFDFFVLWRPYAGLHKLRWPAQQAGRIGALRLDELCNAGWAEWRPTSSYRREWAITLEGLQELTRRLEDAANKKAAATPRP